MNGRFLTQKDMAVAKWDESVAYSRAKRNGERISGVRQYPCGCGTEGCNLTFPQKLGDATLPKTPKKPTKHPKRAEHPMFSGKIIE